MSEPDWLVTARAKGVGLAVGKTAGELMFGIAEALPENCSEKVFQAKVIEFAERQGWLVYHTHDSRRSQKGFPDLVMVRGGRLVFAELKKDGGKQTVDQAKWAFEIMKCMCPGSPVCCHLWFPADWPDILKTLW